MQCKQCGQEFSPSRETHFYCNVKCTKRASYERHKERYSYEKKLKYNANRPAPEQKQCEICNKWFVPHTSLQTSCGPECRRVVVRRYKRQWQKKDVCIDYQKQYREEHAEELSRKAVIRVREWRKKNKLKYLIKNNGNKCSGKWFEVMAYYEWTCSECDKEAQLVHHIDEDTTNNSKSNLAALCRACHCKIHKPHQFHKT